MTTSYNVNYKAYRGSIVYSIKAMLATRTTAQSFVPRSSREDCCYVVSKKGIFYHLEKRMKISNKLSLLLYNFSLVISSIISRDNFPFERKISMREMDDEVSFWNKIPSLSGPLRRTRLRFIHRTRVYQSEKIKRAAKIHADALIYIGWWPPRIWPRNGHVNPVQAVFENPRREGEGEGGEQMFLPGTSI